MPNYEPTPRRFSIITVSHSASRRNSIDDSARPGLNDLHSLPIPDSPPQDLAAALRRLQHVEPQGEAERGRSRVAGGDKGIRATWGHDGPMTAPSARRGSSASTRERIAVWEERSRSKSKGRSKSRGGDVGSWHRVSIVPEVPELSAAFAVFDEEERMKAVVEQGDAAEYPAGTEENAVDDSDDGEDDTAAKENKLGELEVEMGEATQDWMTLERADTVTTTHEDSDQEVIPPRNTSPAALGTAQGEEEDVERPTTPVRQIRARPLTPEATPPPASMLHGAESQKVWDDEDSKEQHRTPDTPETPSTPSPTNDPRRTPGALPLTPDATPEQTRKSPHPVGERALATSAGMYTPVFQPKKAGTHLSIERIPDQAQPQPEEPAELFSKGPSEVERELSPKPAAPIPPSQPAESRDEHPTQPDDSRYHDVWRINSYQPEFPLPDRQPEHLDAETLEQAPFTGNPLQELPRGQLPPEPRNHEANNIQAPYPYPRPNDSRTGDWVVSIPPSPTAAYFQEDPTTRPPPRARSRSRAGTERYVNRNDARRHEWDAPPVIERAIHAASVSMMQGLNVPVEVYRGLRDTYYPAPDKPDIIKAYPVRRRLPVR